MRTVRYTLAVLYVGIVGVLAGLGNAGRNQGPSWMWVAAIVLTLPAFVLALPITYVIGSSIWNITDAGNGGPMWPVTVVYAVLFAAIAVANLVLLALTRKEWMRRKRGRQPQPLQIRASG
jgi:ABC-type dipeptide/oligopeptide/nickel transport system permease subunit